MNIYAICFTPGGEKTLGTILDGIAGWPADQTRVFPYVLGSFREKPDSDLGQQDMRISLWKGRLSEWMKETITNADAYVFVGAAGISLRAIAPYVADKTKDPALVVIDEKGQFVIPLLSGHIGGANALAKQIAEDLGAQPVLTTATDVRGLFAVDVFAKNNRLWISDMKQAKNISAALLRGEKVGFFSEIPWEGTLPEGLTVRKEDDPVYGIVISSDEEQKIFDEQLLLVPQDLMIGAGCRKETPAEKILRAVEQTLETGHMTRHAVCGIASIDLKKEEEGLIGTARKLDVPFETFSAEELAAVDGDFSESSFVKDVTGVDNVCERAAVLASGGELVIKKQAADGVTVAVAKKKFGIKFE